MKNFAKLLIIFGLGCYVFGGFLIWERNNPNRLAFKNYQENYKNVAVSNPPTRIIIRDLGIDIPILPAKVISNQWETTIQGASYLLSSPVPGEIGNSIIYSHDWVSLFGPLLNAETGERVEIEFADKTRKIFIIRQTSVVSNNELSVLAPTKDKRITLYTCTGFLDSQRFVVVANLGK
ncbi:sortase [Patescibacteria group bacterium]|nr:sortase [Patescibacteria group bacterium]MBU4016009.1 sortase [Patescibacteria group bacterium]MBU4099159.1 sortase [Patescibacteria group bacterium]